MQTPIFATHSEKKEGEIKGGGKNIRKSLQLKNFKN